MTDAAQPARSWTSERWTTLILPRTKVSGRLALVALLLASSSFARAAENSADGASRWVRALAGHDTDQIVSSTRLPFVFRTTGRDRTCEGWVRTKKALSAWVTCVAKREDVRNLRAFLGADGVDVQSGWASAGQPKADDIALKIGGLRGWSEWRLVSVTHLWTTISVRLLDRSADGRFLAGAMIVEIKNSHD